MKFATATSEADPNLRYVPPRTGELALGLFSAVTGPGLPFLRVAGVQHDKVDPKLLGLNEVLHEPAPVDLTHAAGTVAVHI